MKISILLTLSIFAVSIAHAQSNADNWHQWRGPENNGVLHPLKPGRTDAPIKNP